MERSDWEELEKLISALAQKAVSDKRPSVVANIRALKKEQREIERDPKQDAE